MVDRAGWPKLLSSASDPQTPWSPGQITFQMILQFIITTLINEKDMNKYQKGEFGSIAGLTFISAAEGNMS